MPCLIPQFQPRATPLQHHHPLPNLPSLNFLPKTACKFPPTLHKLGTKTPHFRKKRGPHGKTAKKTQGITTQKQLSYKIQFGQKSGSVVPSWHHHTKHRAVALRNHDHQTILNTEHPIAIPKPLYIPIDVKTGTRAVNELARPSSTFHSQYPMIDTPRQSPRHEVFTLSPRH